ncbi:ethanolamine ammonia-lyase subunit EutC [Pedobacter sp. AW1-32]|uniref:ethanolamine ammonia-lyase subunit EutC n=1 Tax=Pedobacter sp. AW1-32 TaxID=3383026 RepID=UPI003FF0D087
MADLQKTDDWAILKQLTDARVALGRTGVSLPTKALLEFKLAHAHAKDAVYSVQSSQAIADSLEAKSQAYLSVTSQASTRDVYLQRPDLGRRLHPESVRLLTELHCRPSNICIVLADGLSAIGINTYISEILSILIPQIKQSGFSLSPVVLAEQARVALGDEIGSLLNADLTILFIGERPGLTAADSVGCYITYKPIIGTTDESRNCVSNIRSKGLDIHQAVEKIMYLTRQSFNLKLSGVKLKDLSAVKCIEKENRL